MQPLGLRPVKFPGKTDCHPRKPFVNWWEAECGGPNKALAKREAQKEISAEIEAHEVQVCPDCEAPVRRAILTERIPCGAGPDAVVLEAQVPVYTCDRCGTQYTWGEEAEPIREAVVAAYKALHTTMEDPLLR